MTTPELPLFNRSIAASRTEAGNDVVRDLNVVSVDDDGLLRRGRALVR